MESIEPNNQFGTPEVYQNERIVESVATVVRRQSPQYVQDDFPRFLDFIEAYYKYVDSGHGPRHLLKKLESFADVDTTRDPFLPLLQKEVLSRFPSEFYIDPQDPKKRVDLRSIIKNIVQFYGAKGSERAFEYLFRILYGIDIGFYYPRVDIFRTSDATWVQNYTIRVTTNSTTNTPFDLINQKIMGQSSLASATVEYANSFTVGFDTIYELFLNKSSIVGEFFPGEDIVTDSIPGFVINPSSCIVGFDLYDRGLGYSEGDVVTSNFGLFGVEEFTGIVSAVRNDGLVLSVSVLSPGFNIPLSAFSTINPFDRTYSGLLSYTNSGDNQLHVVPKIGTIVKYRGFFLDDTSQTSSTKRIQDGYFYQQFSYVIKSSESLNTYESIVKDLVHPSGLKLFGEFTSENFVDSRLAIGDHIIDIVDISVAEYDLPTEQQTDVILDIEVDHLDQNQEVGFENVLRSSLGMNYHTLDLIKFTFKPNQKNDDNRMGVGVNSIYWLSGFANYQIKDFANYTVYDFIHNPSKRTNIQPEPIVTIANFPEVDVDVDVARPLPPYPVQTVVVQTGIPPQNRFGVPEIA
jgi:hypothetical protein